MDSEEEKTGEIHGTSQSSSLIQGIVEQAAIDEQDENRGEIQQRATHEEEEEEEYRSQPDPIPLDLIVEILSRLPAKSIVRFLCVSKLWSSFTTLPSFISSFASRPRRLLLTFFKKKRRFVFSFPQYENTDESYSPVYSYELQNTNTWRRPKCYYPSASVQGFILFKRNVIWNPTTGQVLHLPKPTRKLKRRGQSVLGYDPLDGKYKVLVVNLQQHGILTLGAQESWRFIPKGSHIHFCNRCYGCIDGVIYYRAFLGVGGECCIMSFHVGSEKFNPIRYPEGYSSSGFHMIVPYGEGKLALVDTTYFFLNKSVRLWVLEDADGHEWTYTSFTLPLATRRWRGSNNLLLKGVSDAGELVFTPMVLTASFYVLYFDPRRNTIKEALFQGIFGDVLGCRYGLGDDNGKYSNTVNLDVFPNHMENFMSL
ncbi:PREDICTED: putative F-box protein At1g50870 [Camelina sativa]|uniref:F-box protein At1g50870 n=1 Tax=Camelina sativa TaxID=90675 RepID=A0ABM0Y4D2_CAMSA|nr:PREDICTED: putative F-box protein At1g50870 [Camelina sativa]